MKYNKVRMIAKAGNGLRIPKFQNPFGSINLLDYNPYKGGLGGDLYKLTNPNPNNTGSTSPINGNNLGGALGKLKGNLKDKSFISNDQLKNIGMGGANMGLDMLEGQFNDSINSSGVDTMFTAGDTVANVLRTINPVAYLVSKGVMTTLKGINSLGGKKSEAFSADQNTTASVGGSYGGSVNDINSAAAKAGKKYGLFSSRKRRKANREIREAGRQQNIMTNIADEAADQRGMINDINYLRYNSDINGRYDLANIRAAKLGMKILDKVNLIKNRNLHSSYINVDTKSIEEFKEGGSIQPEWMPIIEDIWEPVIEEFKEGGSLKSEWKPIIEFQETPLNISKIKNYYKDYNLDDIQFIYDESPRVEGNNLYVKTDEDAIHELWHFLSQNKPNEIYKEFYYNLNDDKIIELGGDINFVKRFENDPGHFYHPSELEARIKAAKFNSQGQEYTKDFFKNLRSDENKYGYNMRDLLHMYNDENLEKIFNLKKGGILKTQEETSEIEETTQKNVIPEGALHKNKHHMEHTEGLTQKGIPVVDNEGNQQAEIELNEIIFNLEVTKFMEERYHKYFNSETTQKEKDQLAIEVGELLVDQILNNTDDRTNLIETVEV